MVVAYLSQKLPADEGGEQMCCYFKEGAYLYSKGDGADGTAYVAITESTSAGEKEIFRSSAFGRDVFVKHISGPYFIIIQQYKASFNIIDVNHPDTFSESQAIGSGGATEFRRISETSFEYIRVSSSTNVIGIFRYSEDLVRVSFDDKLQVTTTRTTICPSSSYWPGHENARDVPYCTVLAYNKRNR